LPLNMAKFHVFLLVTGLKPFLIFSCRF